MISPSTPGRKRITAAAVALLGLTGTLLVIAQPASATPPSAWTTQSPANAPSPRLQSSMAFDVGTGQVIMFGGNTGVNGGSNDTWEWDGTNWVQLFPAVSPPTRVNAGLGYDAASGQLVLFGGDGPSGSQLNDTWTWDGADWTQQFPLHVPTARVYPAVAYDASSSTLLMFGGFGPSGPLGDTWRWNGTDWAQVNPSSSPSARTAAVMADDPTTGSVVLFGGTDSSSELGDTWTWDGTTWTQQFPATAPSPRSLSAMAFDSTSGDLVLYGGSGSVPLLGDTWTWDGTTWTQLPDTGTPGPLIYATMSDDPENGDVVLFGGMDGSFSLTSGTYTWTAPPGVPTSAVATAGTGQASVAFIAPTTTGGSSITGYTVTATDVTTPGNGGQTMSGTTSPIVVTSLTAGDSYTFAVTATNSAGAVSASSLDSNAVVPTAAVVGPVTALTTPTVTQISGGDDVATAIDISKRSFPDAGLAGAVVLANAGNFADVLSATPLAKAHGAPLLLTPTALLDAGTAAEIARVLPAGGTVYLLGGTASLSPAVATALTSDGFVVIRLGGADRYATSVDVAESLDSSGPVLLANGLTFPDGLAAGVAAAHVDGVVLLTDGSALPAATAAYLAAHTGPVTAVGGAAATADSAATPIVGADRYSTAALLAGAFFTTPSVVGVGSGTSYSDALAAGAELAADRAPLLWSAAAEPTATSGYLASTKSSVVAVNVYGPASLASLLP